MIKILFIGDIVGKAGRDTIAHFLPRLKAEHNFDLVIANGENTTHGRGLNKKHYEELISLGIDVITLGNHFDDRDEIRRYLPSVNNVVRPLNLIENYPGDGSIVVKSKQGIPVRITNILGQAFMKEVITSPLASLRMLLVNNPKTIHIIDYHAEATAEKMTMAWELDGDISALLGTHTHVQTRDARLLLKGTAYISDVGMTGAYNGVIGAERTSVINKMWYDKKIPFNYDNDDDDTQLSAVILEIDEVSCQTTKITPVYEIWNKDEQ